MSRRHGNALWIAFGVILVVGIGAIGLAVLTQNNTRQTALQHQEADLRFAAQAAISNFANRFKMDSWPNRWWRDQSAPLIQPMPEVPVVGLVAYRGKAVKVWVRDSVRSSLLITGCADVFARVEDQGLVMGLYQRLKIIEPWRLDPRALVVQREVSVREDLEPAAARDKLLAQVIADEKTEEQLLPRADVAQRMAAAAGATDLPPATALAQAAAAYGSGEGATEKTFQTQLAQAELAVESGDIQQAITLCSALVGMADGSPAEQKVQRGIAARLMLARGYYVKGLLSAEPERKSNLDQAITALDQVLAVPGGCAGPRAAVLEQDAKAAERPALTKAQRQQLRSDVEAQLTALLAPLPAGSTFGDGPVLVNEIPQAVAAAYLGTVAFRERYISVGSGWQRQQVSLLDDDGATDSYQTMRYAGAPFPIDWFPYYAALLIGDLDYGPFEAPLVVNRLGQVLRRYTDVRPYPSGEWLGVHINPAGNMLAFQGMYQGVFSTNYQAAELRNPVPRVIGDTAAPDRTNNVVSFSPDGRWAMVVQRTRGLFLVDAAQFLAGAYAGALPGTPLWDLNQYPVTTFRMTWVTNGTSTWLAWWGDAPSVTQPPRGRVHVTDPTNPAATIVWPPFANGFAPLRCSLRQSPAQELVLLNGDGTSFVTAPFPAGPTTWATPTPLSPAMFQNSDPNNVAQAMTGVAFAPDGRFFFGGPDDTGLWTLDTSQATPQLRKLDTPVPGGDVITDVARPVR